MDRLVRWNLLFLKEFRAGGPRQASNASRRVSVGVFSPKYPTEQERHYQYPL